MFRVVIHPQAKSDILRNATWWADKHSVDQAIEWTDTVEKQLQDLSSFPERVSLAPESEFFPYEIRHTPVGLGTRRIYLAIYTIKGDAVHVLAVLRAQQDDLAADDLPSSV